LFPILIINPNSCLYKSKKENQRRRAKITIISRKPKSKTEKPNCKIPATTVLHHNQTETAPYQKKKQQKQKSKERKNSRQKENAH
jgi:hypothetical protein